ncbi:F120 [Hirschfeldia incana]|nr:F120 [Hirschfeldia incana]
MSQTGHLDPTAPAFLPANLNQNPIPIPFFMPTRIYLPLPPPPPPPPHPRFFPVFAGPPPRLPPSLSIPTRTLVLLPVPADVSESSIRRDLEVFGEVRGVQMERAHEGIVTVHFYDLRHSQRALTEIRELHMHQHQQVRFGAARGLVSGRTAWAHFVFPHFRAVPEGNNQGSLVVFNLEPSVSSGALRQIFESYGKVKELRETPFKREQRFVEFYDVRDAALARREMDGKSIDGKPIVVQFSRPGGFNKKLILASRFNNKNFLCNHHHPPPPPPHFRRQEPSQLRRREPVKGKPVKTNLSLGDSERYEQNKKRYSKMHNTTKNRVVDCRFIINEDAIAESRDGRTTVMIKNIPNKYTQKLLLEMLDKHCNDCNEKNISEGNQTPMSSYDFVYLPIDFGNNCNVGYGFVNMTTPEAVWRLYKAFHNSPWKLFQSSKICEVTYARVQGLESLKEHFKHLRLPRVEMGYKPVIFSPPRNGLVLTEPISIVVDLGTKPVEDSCHSETVTSCSSSDKTIERSDSWLGERTEVGGVSDDGSKTVVSC